MQLQYLLSHCLITYASMMQKVMDGSTYFMHPPFGGAIQGSREGTLCLGGGLVVAPMAPVVRTLRLLTMGPQPTLAHFIFPKADRV